MDRKPKSPRGVMNVEKVRLRDPKEGRESCKSEKIWKVPVETEENTNGSGKEQFWRVGIGGGRGGLKAGARHRIRKPCSLSKVGSE